MANFIPYTANPVVQSGTISFVETMRYSVSQDYVPGPRRFLLCTADINKTVEQYGLSSHFYADDSRLYFYCRPEVTQSLLDTLSCISDIGLMSFNRLRQNPSKRRVHVVCYLVTHPPDRRRLFPHRQCWRETVTSHPKTRCEGDLSI